MLFMKKWDFNQEFLGKVYIVHSCKLVVIKVVIVCDEKLCLATCVSSYLWGKLYCLDVLTLTPFLEPWLIIILLFFRFAVCQDFMMREDGALAHQLQEEECNYYHYPFGGGGVKT